MTHDELLAEINRLDKALTDSYGMSALRAVIDLHRPMSTKKGYKIEVNCMTCIVYRPSGWSNKKYPCPTVEAIQKELN